jgi:hypothetical protein
LTDSRITWGSPEHRWDAGRKIFSPIEQPHVFRYCGDVVFPSLVLGQVVSAIDQGIIFDPSDTADMKHQAIYESIKTSHQGRHNIPEQDFSIIHIMRRSAWPITAFSAWSIRYLASSRQWSSEELPVPTRTGVLIALGSGATAAKSHERKWNESDVGGTSRAIFSAFCESISSNADELSGGPPQLSGVYSDKPPRTLGIILNRQPFLHGLQLKIGMALSNIEWRDELFQRIDPTNMQPVKGARRFARPKFNRKSKRLIPASSEVRNRIWLPAGPALSNRWRGATDGLDVEAVRPYVSRCFSIQDDLECSFVVEGYYEHAVRFKCF